MIKHIIEHLHVQPAIEPSAFQVLAEEALNQGLEIRPSARVSPRHFGEMLYCRKVHEEEPAVLTEQISEFVLSPFVPSVLGNECDPADASSGF